MRLVQPSVCHPIRADDLILPFLHIKIRVIRQNQDEIYIRTPEKPGNSVSLII